MSPRRTLLPAQGRQSAQQSNCNRRRRTGATTSRDAGTNTDFHRESSWGWERVDGSLQQRVAGAPGRPRDDGVPVAECIHVEHHQVPAYRRADRNLYSRRHCDIQDPSRTPKPCVGPPTVVTNPHGSGRLDHRPRYPIVGVNSAPSVARTRGRTPQVDLTLALGVPASAN